MMRHPFLIFMTIVGIAVGSAVLFIQSSKFASIAKRTLSKYIPKNTGIEGDFKEFRITLFPPGIALTDPKVFISKDNILGLPSGSSLRAARMELKFYPLQMLSGAIRVHEVGIVGADLELLLSDSGMDKKNKKLKSNQISWDDFVEIKLDAVSLKDSFVRIIFPRKEGQVEFKAKKLLLKQILDNQKPEFELSADTTQVSLQHKKMEKFPSLLDEINLSVSANEQGVTVHRLQVVDRFQGNSGIFEASGKIQGDVLIAKNLPFDSHISLSGDIQRILTLLNSRSMVKGDIKFEGKVLGDLQAIPSSLKGEGVLSGKRLQFKGWNSESASVNLKWNGTGEEESNQLIIEKAEFSSPERARVGGFQPGNGGTLKLATFTVPIQKIVQSGPFEIDVPITLDRAHIHWLAAGSLADVYSLDFRATGSLLGHFFRSKKGVPIQVKAKSDLRILAFQLDNQRLNKTKALKKVLSIPEFKVSGDLEIDSKEFRPLDMSLEIGQSKLIAGGKVNFENGFDLKAKGKVNLKDVGTIAEKPVEGTGSLEVKVHGPAKRVFIDFIANLENTSYLNLNLGDLQGQVTWDDDPQRLIFSDVKALKGQTAYKGGGELDLKNEGKIDMSFDFASSDKTGNIQDVIQIFQNLTSNLSWYPNTMIGATYGKVKISGGLDLNQLQVVGDLRGMNWEYQREKLRTVAFKLSYDKGNYLFQDFRATKNQGQIFGSVLYNTHGEMDWKLKTLGLQLADFEHFARINAPVRGALSIESSGQGRGEDIQSTTHIKVSDYFVRGLSMPSSEGVIETASKVATLKGSLLGNQAKIDLKYSLQKGKVSQLKFSADHLDMVPLILVLNPKLLGDPELQSFISADADLKFNTGAFEFGTGSWSVTEAVAQKSGFKMQLLRPAKFNVNGGSFNLTKVEFKSPSAEVLAELSGQDARVSGSIAGQVDAGILQFLTPVILQAKGKVDLDLGMSGSVKDPSLLGKISFDSLYAKTTAIEQPFENVSGSFQVKKGGLAVQYLNADLATGRVSASGTVDLFWDKPPKLSLKANLNDNKLTIFPFRFIKIRGKLSLTGDAIPYQVKGDVTIDSALSRENVLNRVKDQTRKSVRFMPVSESDSGQLPLFSLDIRAKADRGIAILNDLFDAELKGDIQVVNTIDAPRLLGKAEVVQGRLIFKDHNFQIQSGEIEFDNPSVLDPKFNLTAYTEVNSNRIRLYAYGYVSQIKVDLTSNPALSEQQILSLLAIGVTNDDLKRLRAGDRGLLQQGEAASLLLYSLDFNREVQEKTGLRIQVEEAIDDQAGTSIFRSQNASVENNAASPKIVIKRSIGKRLDLSVGSTVGVGTSTQREVNAEVKVTPGASMIGVWNAFEGVNTQDDRTSYGVDFKLQKRFK